VQQGRISPRSDLKPLYPRLGLPGLRLVPSIPSVADDSSRRYHVSYTLSLKKLNRNGKDLHEASPVIFLHRLFTSQYQL
jgi:hypothetical protein